MAQKAAAHAAAVAAAVAVVGLAVAKSALEAATAAEDARSVELARLADVNAAATTIQARQRGIMGRATSAEMRAAKLVAALASLAATSALQCAAAAT